MDNLPQPVSFEAALEKFTAWLKLQKRARATIIAYGNDLAQLMAYCQSHRITQATTIQTPHLQDYLNYLAGNGYTPKSVSRKTNSIKTFFKFLNQRQLTPTNPALPLTHPKYTLAPPRVLTPGEYRSLRDACRLDIRLAAIVELLLQTGVRISELANLHLEDVAKNELVIRPQENRPARSVPLNRTTSAAVQNYQAIRPQVASSHLFVTKTGRPLLIRNIRTTIDRYFRRAGIKNARVNDLRHTFITHQLAAGVDAEYLSRLVGHRRLASTTKYFPVGRHGVKIPPSKLTEL